MVNKLEDKEFAWHEGQAAAPGWSTQEAQKFFDAPSKLLMKRLNELIGEAEKLEEELGVLVGDKVGDIEPWLDDKDVAKKYPTIMAVVNYIRQQPFEKLSNRAGDMDFVLSDDPTVKESTYPTVGAVASYVMEKVVDIYGAIEDVRQVANDAKGQGDGLQVQIGEGFSEGNTVQMRIDELWQSVIDLGDNFRRNLSALSEDMGDVEAALEQILTLQQNFIGGDAA